MLGPDTAAKYGSGGHRPLRRRDVEGCRRRPALSDRLAMRSTMSSTASCTGRSAGSASPSSRTSCISWPSSGARRPGSWKASTSGCSRAALRACPLHGPGGGGHRLHGHPALRHVTRQAPAGAGGSLCSPSPPTRCGTPRSSTSCRTSRSRSTGRGPTGPRREGAPPGPRRSWPWSGPGPGTPLARRRTRPRGGQEGLTAEELETLRIEAASRRARDARTRRGPGGGSARALAARAGSPSPCWRRGSPRTIVRRAAGLLPLAPRRAGLRSGAAWGPELTARCR